MKPTSQTKKLGQQGEDVALSYLLNRGYQLLERNYRHRRSEIDLILKTISTIIFVEVKYRKNNAYGYPEEFVSANQKRSIIAGANHYLTEIDWPGNIRFDIVSIDAQMRIEHFEDAFY